MSPRNDLVGRIFGRLYVTEFAGYRQSGTSRTKQQRARWHVRCACGTTATVWAHNLLKGQSKSCGCTRRGMQFKAWTPDPAYSTAHDRVRRIVGPASDHDCVDCGKQAHEWSYDGRDPDERVEIHNGRPTPFTWNPAHLEPRCRSCHRRLDHARAKARREAVS